jgi:hypothetical protein
MNIYQLSQDASIVAAPTESNDWDAVELSNLLGTDTAVVLDRSGQTYKDDGSRWLPFVEGCRTVAFPG